MEGEYIDSVVFDKADLKKERISDVTYDGCRFVNCNFSSCRFSGVKFLSCTFCRCDFSLSAFGGMVVDDAKFEECKMVGASFEGDGRNAFSASFTGCILSHTAFIKIKAAGILFRDCRMEETLFSDCGISSSVFDGCTMPGASFAGCDCTGADFSSSGGFVLDPEANRVKGAKFSLAALPGLLTKYKIKIVG